MLTGKITTRGAVASDFQTMFGEGTPRTVRAQVFERDGEILGMIGHYVERGVATVFSDYLVEVPKMTVWRASVRYMKTIKMPCICTGTDETRPFLERLGWEYVGAVDDGSVFRFVPQNRCDK